MNTHMNKVILARKMMTNEEIKRGVPIFQSEAWNKRSEAIKKRVKKQQSAAHERALQRAKDREENKKLIDNHDSKKTEVDG